MGNLITGSHPERGPLFAAVVPETRFTEGKVADSRLGALLAPFRSPDEARAALTDAGAVEGGAHG